MDKDCQNISFIAYNDSKFSLPCTNDTIDRPPPRTRLARLLSRDLKVFITLLGIIGMFILITSLLYHLVTS